MGLEFRGKIAAEDLGFRVQLIVWYLLLVVPSCRFAALSAGFPGPTTRNTDRTMTITMANSSSTCRKNEYASNAHSHKNARGFIHSNACTRTNTTTTTMATDTAIGTSFVLNENIVTMSDGRLWLL